MTEESKIPVMVLDGHVVDDGHEVHEPGAVFDLPIEEAERLHGLDIVELLGDMVPDDPRRAAAEEMTVAILKEELDALKVEYPAGVKKAALVDLYLAATAGGEG